MPAPRYREGWPAGVSAAVDMSASDRRGAMSRVAAKLVADTAGSVQLAKTLSLPNLQAGGSSPSRTRTASILRSDRSGGLYGGEAVTAEALKREFAVVQDRLDHLRTRSRVPDIEGLRRDSIAQSDTAVRTVARTRSAHLERREPEPDELDELGATLTAGKALVESRDPKASVQRKLAKQRGASPPPGQRLPMLQLHVQRAKGTECVSVVDVMALKGRSLLSGNGRSSVASLLEARRQAERQRQLLALAAAQRAAAPLEGVGKLSWEDRYEQVQERRQQRRMQQYLLRMGSRREKTAPEPLMDQFDEEWDET